MQTTDLWAGTALFTDSSVGAYTWKLIRDDAEVRVDQVRRSPPGLQGALFWRRADSQSGLQHASLSLDPHRTPSDPEAEFARWGPRGGSEPLEQMSCPTIQSPVHCLVNHLSLWTAQDRHKAFNINKAPRTSPRTAVLSDPADSAGVCNLFSQPGRECPGVRAQRRPWGRQVAPGSQTRRGRKTKNKTKTLVETKGFVWLQYMRPKTLTLREARGESWGWGTKGAAWAGM